MSESSVAVELYIGCYTKTEYTLLITRPKSENSESAYEISIDDGRSECVLKTVPKCPTTQLVRMLLSPLKCSPQEDTVEAVASKIKEVMSRALVQRTRDASHRDTVLKTVSMLAQDCNKPDLGGWTTPLQDHVETLGNRIQAVCDTSSSLPPEQRVCDIRGNLPPKNIPTAATRR